MKLTLNKILFLSFQFLILLKFFEKFSEDIRDLTGKIEFLVIVGLFILALTVKGRPLAKPLKLYFFIFAVSTGIGLLGNGGLSAYALAQALLNMKFSMSLYIGYKFCSTEYLVTITHRLHYRLMIISLCLVVWELLSVGSYRVVFPGSMTDTVIVGSDYHRSTGLFFHPGPFGIFCSLVMLYTLLAKQKLNTRDKITAGVALIGIIASGQRQEFLSVISILVVWFLLKSSHPLPWLVSMLVVLIVGVIGQESVVYLYDKVTGNLSTELSINEMAPRLLLLQGSADLANKFFPFGAGLGTYASSMSIANPYNAYAMTDVASAWWYGVGSYLTDTYWAMPFGESGWFGGGLALAGHLYLLQYLLRSWLKMNSGFNRSIVALGVGTMAFGLMDSIGAPVYTGSAVPILMISVPAAYSFYIEKQLR